MKTVILVINRDGRQVRRIELGRVSGKITSGTVARTVETMRACGCYMKGGPRTVNAGGVRVVVIVAAGGF